MTNSENAKTPPEPERTVQAVEIAVFLFLIIPSMALSFVMTPPGAAGFMTTAASAILRDLSLVALIFYFIWRNRETLPRLGLKRQHVGREILIGIFLFFPMFFGAQALELFLLKHGFTSPSTPLPSFSIAVDWKEIVMAILLVIVVAFAEEVIFRGYLLLRFQNLLKHPAISVLLSSLIFSLGHGYAGSAGLITVAAMGIALAAVYLWRNNLAAPMTMHFLQNFIGIVVVSLIEAQ